MVKSEEISMKRLLKNEKQLRITRILEFNQKLVKDKLEEKNEKLENIRNQKIILEMKRQEIKNEINKKKDDYIKKTENLLKTQILKV